VQPHGYRVALICIELPSDIKLRIAPPVSCSFNIPMICSSLNLLRFIRPSPRETNSTQKWHQIRDARQVPTVYQATEQGFNRSL